MLTCFNLQKSSEWYSQLELKFLKPYIFLRSSKNVLSIKGLTAVYYTLIHCHLVYANIIWSSVKTSTYKNLFTLQKKAIRLVTSSKYNSHSEPLFKITNVLPLADLINYFRLQFFQNFKQGFVPTSLKTIWITNQERNNIYALRNQENIYLPVSRLSQFASFPLYLLPRLWIEFTNKDLKIIREKSEFKKKLKEYFIENLNSVVICTRLLCPNCHFNNPP